MGENNYINGYVICSHNNSSLEYETKEGSIFHAGLLLFVQKKNCPLAKREVPHLSSLSFNGR